MNLQNFEQHMDDRILDRGHEYYMENLAEQIDVIDGKYHFHVSGRDLYEVIVMLDVNGEILSSNCDCPYTYGPVCKHEAAVYYELDDLLSMGEPGGRENAQGTFSDVLHALTKDQLVELVEDLAQHDDHLKNRILVRYSQVDAAQGIEQFAEWIRSIVRVNKGKAGYITYHEASRFVGELDDCLAMITDCADEMLALDMAFLLLTEAIEAFEYADDSAGDIGMLVDYVVELIEQVVLDALAAETDQLQMLFDKLLLQCDHPVFTNWEEYQVDLLRIAVHFTDDLEYREELKNKIEAEMEEPASEYHNESLHQLLLEMIEQNGTAEEVRQFLEKYIHYSSFRGQLIELYLRKEEYGQVIQLASEGEQADCELKGLVKKWKYKRYAGYKGLSMREEQLALGKELFMGGDFEFYQDLKSLAEDPQQLYEQLKEELKMSGDWTANMLYRRLIEEENDITELMKYLRKHTEAIETYAANLMGVHEQEVLEIYEEYIKRIAGGSTSRKGYQHVCGIIRRFGKLAGEQMRQVVVSELLDSYRRKPAFVEELRKI